MKYPKDHYSFSAFSKFNECPRRWWFDYVRYPEEKQEIFAFTLGNAYHDALAGIYRGKTIEEALGSFDGAMALVAWSGSARRDVEGIREAVKYYDSVIYPQYRNRIESVEVEELVKIPGIKVPIQFRMDLKTSDGVLVDHKTVGTRAPSVEYNDQLDIYSLLHLTQTGRLPRAVELHLAYKDARKKDRVEIKSYIPKYSDVLKTASLVKSSLEMIERNSFPCKRGRQCSYCPFKGECDGLIISSSGDDII